MANAWANTPIWVAAVELRSRADLTTPVAALGCGADEVHLGDWESEPARRSSRLVVCVVDLGDDGRLVDLGRLNRFPDQNFDRDHVEVL